MAKFKDFIPPEAFVKRGPSFSKIAARLLVPGDIIKIESGNKIPADIRIISCSNMKVDNSSLTVILLMILIGRARAAG